MPGRNDPCPCGSGKKYKHCHQAADRAAGQARAEAERAGEAALEALGHPSDAEMRALYQEMAGQGLPPGPVPEATRASLTELWRRRKQAALALERLAPERRRWEAHFAKQPDELEALAAELDRDPFFDAYVLTKANARRARARLGRPPEDPEARRAYAAEALAMSLDEDDRRNFREAMLSRVAGLVDAGRMKEAYVMATCAEQVVDPKAPPSAFLAGVVFRSLR